MIEIDAPIDEMTHCRWCDHPFTPRSNGGKAQRFCSTDCRRDYFAACRAWGEQEHREGRVPTEKLRNALTQRARLSEGC